MRAAARAAQAERRERGRRRRRALTGWVPRRRTRPSGILERRRRGQVRATVALLVVANVLLWVFVPSWSARALGVVVSLLAAPVLHTMLFRR